MRLFVAYVRDLDTVFDPAVHCETQNDGFSLELREVEGQYAELTIERRQTGYSILAATAPKCILASWSPTGLPTDAMLFARGRMTEMPSDLFGTRQSLTFLCAPKDIDDRVLALAKDTKSQGPETDLLFSDADPEDPAAYLLGRSEVWHVDAATHAIAAVGEVEGERVLDMTSTALVSGGRVSDGLGEFGRPCKTIRGRLVASWQQTASGSCDIGWAIGAFTTLDPSFANNIGSAIQVLPAAGWSTGDGGVRSDIREISGPRVFFAARYESEHLDRSGVTASKSYSANEGDIVRIEHECDVTLRAWRVEVQSFAMSYDFSQEREEVVYAALDLPIQQTGIEDDEDEVVEYALKDLFSDPTIAEYEPGQEYEKGAVRRYNGEIWRCREAHYSTGFGMRKAASVTGWKSFRTAIVPGGTYWERIEEEWAVYPSMSSFIDAVRGQACVAHMMCRLRKEGLRRLRARRVSLQFRWQDAAHVTRADSVVFPGKWSEVEDRAMIGRVTSKIWTWPERSAPMITLEVGVSFGDGSERGDDESFVDDGYIADGYGASGFSARSGMEWYVDADPVESRVPVNALRTTWSVQSVRKGGQREEQTAAANLLAINGKEIRDAPVIRPTWGVVRMKPLEATDTIRREIDVVGALAGGPQGVLLT
ncbi:hypothetical protein SAMN06297251_10134 [Fulvimarina manganoxydans]|uniref:Uncharacterized protein n=1 Tax=Fulvimarina manganoxydans TaxID=937218 RepID=A0A1W1Y8G9_9HYPH|nr:hypothetical protein [Fulvimarina manganoxydans]SMC32457.1 hypothetical protein SAMN06297251_10134 [Fulvimarina manganoxydans]